MGSSFSCGILDVFLYQNGIFCFVDCDRDLYMYDISRKSKIYIRNLSSLVQKYGVITGIVPFYEDIIIGFRANGLIRLRTSKSMKKRSSIVISESMEFIGNRVKGCFGLHRTGREL